MIRCAIRGCNTVGSSGFHSFPTNETSAKKWVDATDSIKKSADMMLERLRNNKLARSFIKVCNKHFKESDYETTGKGKRRLLKGAVPTLMMPGLLRIKFEHDYHSTSTTGVDTGDLQMQAGLIHDATSASVPNVRSSYDAVIRNSNGAATTVHSMNDSAALSTHERLAKIRKKAITHVSDIIAMLVEEGFEVVSVDASDKMLKYALKERWNRRHERGFDKWVIEEANWLTVYNDIKSLVGNGFDVVLCLGNSFAHMLDSFGDQREQKRVIQNFRDCAKPGGLLLIDHRNYDNIMNTGSTPSKCIYYNSKHTSDIKTSVLYIEGKPYLVTLDYLIDIGDDISEFRLSYYPHKLDVFKSMLQDVFGNKTRHTIYGDFKELNEIPTPGFYIHLIEKSK